MKHDDTKHEQEKTKSERPAELKQDRPLSDPPQADPDPPGTAEQVRERAEKMMTQKEAEARAKLEKSIPDPSTALTNGIAHPDTEAEKLGRGEINPHDEEKRRQLNAEADARARRANTPDDRVAVDEQALREKTGTPDPRRLAHSDEADPKHKKK